jgi:hypothetical protein
MRYSRLTSSLGGGGRSGAGMFRSYFDPAEGPCQHLKIERCMLKLGGVVEKTYLLAQMVAGRDLGVSTCRAAFLFH